MYWAWPGLKALTWAWLKRAWAYSNLRSGPDGGLGPGLGSGQGLISKLCIVIVGNIDAILYLMLKFYILVI